MDTPWHYPEAYFGCCIEVPEGQLQVPYAQSIRGVRYGIYTIYPEIHKRLDEASIGERDSMIQIIIGFRIKGMDMNTFNVLARTFMNYIASSNFQDLNISVSSPRFFAGIEHKVNIYV